MNPGRTVWVVVPEGLEDPGEPSGGNTYDRRLCRALADVGWSVRTSAVAGAWPYAGEAGCLALGTALGHLPDTAPVIVDGLIASLVPEVLVPASRRLRLVVLVHLPAGVGSGGNRPDPREGAVLSAAAAVITTSGWSRDWLLAAYGLDPERLHVAHPGVDLGPPAAGSGDGRNLLCVAAVTRQKGHDVLLAALARITDLTWRCVCVGALTRAPGFVSQVRRDVRDAGLHERVVLAGPRTGAELEAAYCRADVLLLASRVESYGMVVTEALARALPVLATDVGGIPEALGVARSGRRPGLLVPDGDVHALADTLRRWLSDGDLRRDLREAARQRRAELTGWSETADRVGRVLAEVGA